MVKSLTVGIDESISLTRRLTNKLKRNSSQEPPSAQEVMRKRGIVVLRSEEDKLAYEKTRRHSKLPVQESGSDFSRVSGFLTAPTGRHQSSQSFSQPSSSKLFPESRNSFSTFPGPKQGKLSDLPVTETGIYHPFNAKVIVEPDEPAEACNAQSNNEVSSQPDKNIAPFGRAQSLQPPRQFTSRPSSRVTHRSSLQSLPEDPQEPSYLPPSPTAERKLRQTQIPELRRTQRRQQLFGERKEAGYQFISSPRTMDEAGGMDRKNRQSAIPVARSTTDHNSPAEYLDNAVNAELRIVGSQPAKHTPQLSKLRKSNTLLERYKVKWLRRIFADQINQEAAELSAIFCNDTKTCKKPLISQRSSMVHAVHFNTDPWRTHSRSLRLTEKPSLH